LLGAGFVSLILSTPRARAAGVTVITHGLNGNVDGWITGMANAIPNYDAFPGTDFAGYTISFVPDGGGGYLVTAERTSGVPPAASASGEIIVKLDWRQLADGNSYDTFQVAEAIAPALLSTNFIPELGGRALAEFPLHLIGHSRGGSLICQLSRLLGEQGVWVDHLTTLDPHPLNDPEFPLDALLFTDVDAPALTYENVLFHDNYWQNDFLIRGKAVPGAFVRELTNLGGGYSLAHSDVHLWYHGTIDWQTPASDTEASIGGSERNAWWTAYEAGGTNAGFLYSRLGAGNRLSPDQPAGVNEIVDGFNQRWDLGAGTADNRVALESNNGDWASLIRVLAGTNAATHGRTAPVMICYQWARPVTEHCTARVRLDPDLNPLNGNELWIEETELPGTGDSSVGYTTLFLELNATNAPAGEYSIGVSLTANGRTRYLYAAERLTVVPPAMPPVLDVVRCAPSELHIGVSGAPGQTLVLEHSADFMTWTPLATNTLQDVRWVYTNSAPLGVGAGFYRAQNIH